jgi:hypothetical protein
MAFHERKLHFVEKVIAALGQVILVCAFSFAQTRSLHASHPNTATAQARPQSIMRKMDLTARICFVQPEISGRMNVEESKVSVSNYQKLTLMGGQAGCLYITPGYYTFRIEFQDSEGLFHRKSESPKYNVSVGEGELAIFEVYPATKNNEYSGAWRARLMQKGTAKDSSGGRP